MNYTGKKYKSFDGTVYDNEFDMSIHDHSALRTLFSNHGIITYGGDGYPRYSVYLNYIYKIVIPNSISLNALYSVYPVLRNHIDSAGVWTRDSLEGKTWKKRN